MEKSQDFVCVCKVPKVGIPSSVKQTISKPSEDEYKDQDRVRGMEGDDNVCDEMASWSNKCHSSLTEVNMNKIVQSSACDIAD